MTGQLIKSGKKFKTIRDVVDYYDGLKPDAVAFTFLTFELENRTETHITYKELKDRALAVRSALFDLRADGERVLLLYPPGFDYICAFLGCLYAGVTAVPAYPPLGQRAVNRFMHIVNDSGAKFILTDRTVATLIREDRHAHEALKALTLLTTDDLDIHNSKNETDNRVTGETIAFLQYTSGSTSNPKGVMVSNSNLIHNLAVMQQSFEYTPEDRLLNWLPPYHDMGLIGGILMPLFNGLTVCQISYFDFLQNPLRWLQAISHYKSTTSGGPNFAYELCTRHAKPGQLEELDLSHWRLAFNGAEPINPTTLHRFAQTFKPCGFRRESFYPCYGLAEGTLFVTGGDPKSAPVIREFDRQNYENNNLTASHTFGHGQTLVGSGRCMKGDSLLIVDPNTLIICPPEQIGEIWIKSPSVTLGYWNQPDKTRDVFQAYLADTNDGPYLRTGDLGVFIDEELFVTGRLKDLIIIQGRNHYPQDIERSMERSHVSLRAGCGAAFPVHESGRERLVVMQEVKQRYLNEIQPDDIILAIKNRIADAHGIEPHAVLLLAPGAIHKTTSGKIQRHACRQAYLERKNEDYR